MVDVLVKKTLQTELQHKVDWQGGNVKETSKPYWDVQTDKWVLYKVDEQFYTILDSSQILIADTIEKKRAIPIALLFSIFIPVHQRRQGQATKLVAELERKANTELGIPLAIGPLMGEENDGLVRICKKRGYKAIAPFSFVQQEFVTPMKAG